MKPIQKEITITGKDNPVVRHYRKLRDQKKIRQDEKLFVIEGLRIVRDALQYPYLVKQVFVTETAWVRHAGIMDFALREPVQMIHITDNIGELMTDTEHTQGVFAVCRVPEPKSVPELLSPDGKYLVLCQIQDPGNLGMILRTCDALGVDAVFTTGCCERYSPKVIRATMGSVFRVPVADMPNALNLLTTLRECGIRSYAAVLSDKAKSLKECRPGCGCAVWIGNEGNGLPESISNNCEYHVRIPMQGGAESLNAAMAAGILTWEMMNCQE